MYKVSDFFGIEAYFDNKQEPLLKFIWEEGGEQYVYDWNNRCLVAGNEKTYTFEIIQDWLEVHENEINQIFSENELHYIVDDPWNT